MADNESGKGTTVREGDARGDLAPSLVAAAAAKRGSAERVAGDGNSPADDEEGADNGNVVPAAAAEDAAGEGADIGNGQGVPTAPAAKPAASSAAAASAAEDAAAPRDDPVDTDGDGNGADIGNGQGVLTAAASSAVASSAKPADAREKDRKEFAEAMKINGKYQKKISDSTHLSDPDKSTDFQVTITYDQNTKEDKQVAILFKNFEIIKVTLPKIARPPAGSRRELSLASTHIQPITYTLMNCLLECYKVIEKKVTFNSVGYNFNTIKGSQLTDDEKQKIVDILSSLNGKTTNPNAYYLSKLAANRHAEDIKFFTKNKESDISKEIELDYLIQFLFNFKLKIKAFADAEYPVQKSYFGAHGDTELIDELQKLRIFPNESPLYPTREERLKRASLDKSRARGLRVVTGDDGDAGNGDALPQGGKPQTRKSKLRRRKTERRNSKRGKK